MTQLPTHPTNPVIAEILTEQYFSIGATPARAIATMWDDLAEKRFDDNLTEWGIDEAELVANILAFSKIVAEAGALHQLIAPTI